MVENILIVGFVILIIFVILLGFYFFRRLINGYKYKNDHVRMDGKIVIVTGANSGIGKETALELARRGATIYLACRNMERCMGACNEIISRTNNTKIYGLQLDLASLNSVREFVREFIAKEQRLDVLINNAGIFACPRGLTTDGFEMQMGVHHLGHFLLTNLLLDTLKQSAPGRIVVVASFVYRFGEIEKNNLNSERSYNRFKMYANSKLANILFVRQLAKKLEGTRVTINALNPNFVRTNIDQHIVPKYFQCLSVFFMAIFFKTPVCGAQTVIRLATDPSLEGVTGKYFSGGKVKSYHPPAMDDTVAEWLWLESEKLTFLT